MSLNDLYITVQRKLDDVVDEFIEVVREEIVNYGLIATGKLYNDIQVYAPTEDTRIVSLVGYADVLNRGTTFKTQPLNLKVIFALIERGVLDPDRRGPMPHHIVIPPRPFLTKALSRIRK